MNIAQETEQEVDSRKRKGKLVSKVITLAHGGGGKAMRDLIDDVFVQAFSNPVLNTLEDQARFHLSDLATEGDRLAMTTDSYVIDPIFFPGGDIGKIAICGTVNDLAVGGAKPLYLTCGMIIEEGMEVNTLRAIVKSMADTAREAGVQIVTGDTKVVEKGSCDKVFINTAGIGVIDKDYHLGADKAQAGDHILVNGYLGDHGAAIMDSRGGMNLSTNIQSDCAPLQGLIQTLLNAAPNTRFIRDATRGGIASVLNEIAEASSCAIQISEQQTPIRQEVIGFCEILGLDPLYLANEGKLVAVVPENEVEAALEAMRGHAFGKDSADIGTILPGGTAGRVHMQTSFGGKRIVDMLIGEQLPRIC
ncbi:hydrogenase expression/formation protein HypE [Thalassomonas actiniarum]|uniref:Hydrogenase expression/formation protein HypE n=1 Tax=Thalassomonas actiniarum TaxID=485447 RepID=A0AAF0C4Y1_9GAMM|nr:hydrogenase expression/formation protein HypE [Thalassomonas actiniarum]WDE00958.1 hydrogenase expression/formation protein HypE [Thalassomonas actiniarum]